MRVLDDGLIYEILSVVGGDSGGPCGFEAAPVGVRIGSRVQYRFDISSDGHAARQLKNEDYDLLIGMDKANFLNMHCICGGNFDGKLHLLMEYAARGPQRKPGEAGCVGRGEARERSEFSPQAETEKSGLCFDEVADPWYTGDFEATWQDVLAGCQGLLRTLGEE